MRVEELMKSINDAVDKVLSDAVTVDQNDPVQVHLDITDYLERDADDRGHTTEVTIPLYQYDHFVRDNNTLDILGQVYRKYGTIPAEILASIFGKEPSNA